MLQEELGYIEGGSETLVKALVADIGKLGGRIVLAEPATRILIANNRVTGVETAKALYPTDAVISTVPLPIAVKLIPDLPPTSRKAYERIVNIGVVCVILKLKRSVSRHFWVNVADATLPIPGIIEFSNLRPTPTGEAIVYVPYYMPITNPLWTRSNDAFIEEALAAVCRINPTISQSDLASAKVNRLGHAQPVCPPGFKMSIPPIQTSIGGLQIADTCYYYPEDRGIAESVRLGQLMADNVGTANV